MNGPKFGVWRKVLRTFSLHHEDRSAATCDAASSRTDQSGLTRPNDLIKGIRKYHLDISRATSRKWESASTKGGRATLFSARAPDSVFCKQLVINMLNQS